MAQVKINAGALLSGLAVLFSIWRKGVGSTLRGVELTRSLRKAQLELARSHKFLERVLGALPNLVAYLDRDLIYRYANPSYEKWFGIPVSEILGRTLRDVIGERTYAIEHAYIERALGGEAAAVEVTVPNKHGGTKHVFVQFYPDIHSDGSVLGIILIVQDVTEIRRKDEEIKNALTLLESILDATPDFIFIKDRQHRYLKVNRSYAAALHRKPEDFIGKTDLELGFDEEFVKGNPEKGIRGYWADDDRVFTTGRLHAFPNDLGTFDGELRTFHTVKAPIFGHDNQVYAMVGISRDISELKEAEIRLIQSSKMASLGEMAGGVAHEINNPLAVIRSTADLLYRLEKREPLPPDQICLQLERITATCDRIARIIKGLRAFSRSAERDPLEHVPIKTVIEDTLSLCAERLRTHGVKLEVGNIPDLSVLGRATQLSQVLLNLLNNAYDAVLPCADRWIRVEAMERSDDWIEIAVTDGGPGISKEVADKVMQPFFTTKSVGKGTGLGLSISKGIVEDHGGRLYIDRSSRNTRLVVELPTRKTSQQGKSA